MPIACPACRKPDQTGDVCARCGCELSSLQTIAEAALSTLQAARDCLAAGNLEAALRGARRSWGLVHTIEAAAVAALASAGLGRTGALLRWRRIWHSADKTVGHREIG